MMFMRIAATVAALLITPACAEVSFFLDGNFEQGGIIRGTTVPGARVEFAGAVLPVSEDGDFVFGLTRDFAAMG